MVSDSCRIITTNDTNKYELYVEHKLTILMFLNF